MSAAPATTREACDPQKAAELLRALAHPMRLRILCRLLDGEVSVAGFESELGLKQPNLSQQLGQLREAALVTTRRAAKSIFYSLADERVRYILDALPLAMGAADTPTAPPALPSPAALAVRPEVAARAETATRAVPAPGGYGVFSVAGWPDGLRPRCDPGG